LAPLITLGDLELQLGIFELELLKIGELKLGALVTRRFQLLNALGSGLLLIVISSTHAATFFFLLLKSKDPWRMMFV
jgi:hypothetical protein